MEDRYWHYQPLPGKTGVSGKVYASVKETKRAIDAGLKRLEREAREAAKKQRVRERPRKIKG